MTMRTVFRLAAAAVSLLIGAERLPLPYCAVAWGALSAALWAAGIGIWEWMASWGT